MSSPYRWLVFVHVASVLGLLLLHGVALAVAYALRRERDRDRIVALLDLALWHFDSRRLSGRIFWINFLVVAFSGLALMIWGGYWRWGWTWVSIAIFVGIVIAMTELGRLRMGAVRKAAGLPYITSRGKPEWVEPVPADAAALEVALNGIRPGLLTVIGGGGFAVLAWLMMFKPF